MNIAPQLLAAIRQARSAWRPPYSPKFLDQPQSSSSWFDEVNSPFIAYPAPGAAAAVVNSIQVPSGHGGVIRKIAVINQGGAYNEGSGQVIWRVLLNGAGVKGLENENSEIGQLTAPADTFIVLEDGDILQVTVEVPLLLPGGGANQSPAGTTAARLVGWYFPYDRE